ncbi:FAD-binding oxidoreductase [Nitrogeniibacter mangrovi]|uniref:FAD-binding oxidoreductase n=1 Tax=Nitrogeniibacter mangrovi TaxID=2016596 RepID=A0A6C1B9C3_9RHOO|nr:FAD-binding oxidoreductase [Nitrogeniibacter mangrovi]QID18844.1 FAD-binding oxidoreductase [Nitrogeniibacter mangrovi]
MDALIDAIRHVVGETGLVRGEAVAARATSYWDPAPCRARAIVRPASTAEVAEVLRLCHAAGQAVVTQGGVTGCSQGADARAGELVLSTERLNAIEAIDPVGGTATVQAGVTLQALQEAARAHDRLFALDLGARGSCTVGGNVATNAGGINVLRYGMMRAQVLGLEAVLADGTIVSSMNHMLKNNSGFDLKQLMIGTEGTLGVVTRVVVRLHPLPASRNTALVALRDFDAVTELLTRMQRDMAGTLSAFEVMWNLYYRAATAPGGHRAPMADAHPFYVLMEAEGADTTADAARFEAVLAAVLDAGLIDDAVLPQSEAERRALWEIRENFEAMLVGRETFLYDVSLPIGEMAGYADEVLAAMDATWPQGRAIIFGHVADGNLHLFIQPQQAGATHAQSDALVYAPLTRRQGAVSAEHGIGQEKLGWLDRCRSAAEIALMRTLKQALDPKGILNPGRVIPPP